jgi:hypothetical protein
LGKVVAAVVVAAALVPATAQAATVTGADSGTTRTITYAAAAGEVNQPVVTRQEQAS